ncbi:MAG: patatin-like phospholipase family protein [Bauldia sp.]
MASSGGGRGERIGLALGGGGARGFAHVAVIEALDELGLRPAIIAGTSMGAVIGAGCAAGMTGAAIRSYAIELFAKRSDVLGRIWQLRPKSVSDLFAQGVTQLDAERVVEAFLPKDLPEEFAGLATPLRVIATDFYGWSEAVIEHGPLRRAVAASAAIPALFRPVLADGRVLIDGGVTNPLPFDRLGEDCDITIAVDVIGGPMSSHARIPGTTEALFGAAQLFMQSVTREKLRSGRPPDIVIRAPANAFRALDFMKAAEILRAAEPMKEDLKRKMERVFA